MIINAWKRIWKGCCWSLSSLDLYQSHKTSMSPNIQTDLFHFRCSTFLLTRRLAQSTMVHQVKMTQISGICQQVRKMVKVNGFGRFFQSIHYGLTLTSCKQFHFPIQIIRTNYEKVSKCENKHKKILSFPTIRIMQLKKV